MRIKATASRTRLAAVPVAMLLLAAAAATPVWFANLIAPQYPKGLWLYAYGTRLEGDLGEINNLNHYIGMPPLSLIDVPELQLWFPALAGLAVLALAGLFLDGRLGSLSRILLWVVPFGILADIQRWLIHYGRDLDPEAALRLKPFVPLVIGPTQVLAIVALDPLDAARTLGLIGLGGDAQILGPSGALLLDSLGAARTMALLACLQLLWAMLAASAAALILRPSQLR